MPIFPVQQPSRKTLAALLLPAWLQMQTSPTGSLKSLKEGLDELERVLED
jgi:hypothetical protein